MTWPFYGNKCKKTNQFKTHCKDDAMIYMYNTRTRTHNKTLITKTTDLNDRDFLIRMLYKDCY